MCQSNKFCKSIFIITNNICFMVVRSSSICFYRFNIKKVTKSRNYIIGPAFALCGQLHDSWSARKGNIKLFPQNSSINLLMFNHNFSSLENALGFSTDMEINYWLCRYASCSCIRCYRLCRILKTKIKSFYRRFYFEFFRKWN